MMSIRHDAKVLDSFVRDLPLVDEEEEEKGSMLQATLELIVQVLGPDEFSSEEYGEQVNDEDLATLGKMVEANFVEDLGDGLFKIKDRHFYDL